ncbi:haloacid dehalogenase-like hydrolase [Actinoplanes solisilvae]|uniref:haloacid dehalogenase-like hydrolase n=1 Tax=Actinoplanes solisilvae TaxID=2486853 RepID=UPI000FDBAABF|nr:haloacid dehalogenase-like hydrolase [Actinoplanes solisilvae]
MRTVLFDFDGVLVRGDSFALFLRRRALRGWRAVLAVLALPAVIFLALLPGQWARAARLVTRIGTFGLRSEVLHQRLADFGPALAHEPGRIIAAGVNALQQHLADGDRVVVVTASEETLARSVLDQLRLSTAELIGSRLLSPSGSVHNRGAEKLRQLAARGIIAPWDIAYSDSPVDLPLLSGARRPILVNGRPADIAKLNAALGGKLEAVVWPAQAANTDD